MSAFQQFKFWLIGTFGLEKDALHIYFGLMVMFACAALFRWRLANGRPQLAVLAMAILGEIWDVRDGLKYLVPLAVSIPASIHDLWNTMFWPVAILLLARYTRLFDRHASDAPSDSSDNQIG